MSHEALIDAAIAFASERRPTGEIVAAAAETKQGRLLTGIWCDARVDSAALCAETGPICQTHALNDPIIASVCVVRDNTDAPFQILPACGICQEPGTFGVLGARCVDRRARYYHRRHLRLPHSPIPETAILGCVGELDARATSAQFVLHSSFTPRSP